MWEKINKFVHSQVVLSVFLISAFFISVLTGLGILLIDMTPSIRLAFFTVGQLILWFIVVWLMRKTGVFNANDFQFKGIAKGLLLAWVGILVAIITFISMFLQLPENSSLSSDVFYVLIVILHPLIGTALFEETLYRGFVLKILLQKIGHSKKGIINACLISAAFFGMLHIANVFAGADVLSVALQIVCAMAGGFFYAALFLRTKTLWIPILVHALENLAAQIFGVIVSPNVLPPATQAEIDVPSLITGILALTVPYIIAGFVLLKKVEPDGVLEEA